MSTLLHNCLVLVLGLAACGGKQPQAGAVIAGCDATHDPTPAAAYAQYLAEGGEPVEAPQLVHVMYEEKPTDQFDVMYVPGPHQPSTGLGTIYKCKLYRDDKRLAQALVLDAGWASASPTARKALALAADARANGRALNAVPKNWQSAYTFAGPEAFDGAGGSVRIVGWRNHVKVTSYRDGSAEDVYVQQEWIFAADGSVTGPKTLASFNAGDPDAARL